MEWRLFPGEWYLDAGALLLALLLDIVLRELPNTVHPVVWMGKAISGLERVGPSGNGRMASFAWGTFMAIAVPPAFGGMAWVAANGLRELGSIPYLLGGAVLLSTTFAVAGLARAARNVQEYMEAGSMAEARYSLRNLVSRETATLERPLAAAAAIESVAENTTDSYVSPWLAFAMLGLPGAFAYRAVNTLDSMIGYRGRYEYLGKMSAKLDDVLNLIPARLSAVLILLAGFLHRLPVGRGWHMAWSSRKSTASPNAGWTIGAMSGLLGVALQKEGHYHIGEGLKEPCSQDIGRSVHVACLVAAIALASAIGVLVLRGMVEG